MGLVDLTVRQRPGVIGFRFSAASNFDSSFTAFQTVPNYGYRSATAPQPDDVGSQFRDQCRFLFNPSDYTASVPAVRDDLPFYVRLEPQNPDGSFGAAEAMHLVLPYAPGPNRSVVLHGFAPTAASATGAREIQLPQLCNDFLIKNQSTGAALNVAFERGQGNGPEYRVDPGKDLTLDYTTIYELFVRGESGSAAELYAVLTVKNNPFSS